jgi:malate/lactate dehydrogenase
MKIVVIGGTGRIGSKLVTKLKFLLTMQRQGI